MNPRATLLLCGLGTVAAGACALGDLFGPAGSGDVRFEFTGPSTISRGVATAIAVSLRVDGVPVTEPPIELSIPDTSVIQFRTTHDTIIGCRAGDGDIVARISSSLSPSIDTVFTIRVTGGSACP
jgi:hypothetical protein